MSATNPINFDTVMVPRMNSCDAETIRMTYVADLERTTRIDTDEHSVHFKLNEEITELDEQYKVLSSRLIVNIDKRIASLTESISNLMANLTDQELIMRITYNDAELLQFKTVFVVVNDDFVETLIGVTKKFKIRKIDVFGKVLNAKPWVTQLSDLISERGSHSE